MKTSIPRGLKLQQRLQHAKMIESNGLFEVDQVPFGLGDFLEPVVNLLRLDLSGIVELLLDGGLAVFIAEFLFPHERDL